MALTDDVDILRAQLADALTEVLVWQAAAQDTAHTCTVTLERILEMEIVVKAAQAWRADRFNEHDATPTAETLVQRVDAYTNQRKQAS